MNDIQTRKKYISSGTYKCRYLRVFPASLHIGRIPLAKSIRFLYFSLMLTYVFGRKVPLSSSLTISNIVDIQYSRYFRWWYIDVIKNIQKFDFLLRHVLLQKGYYLIIKLGMMSMVQTTVGSEIPMVVAVEIESNSHWTLLVRS
jgi:hypothetical protein